MTGTIITIGIEPFLSTYFDKSQGGAYPHVPSSTPLLPIVIQFGWLLSEKDEYFINKTKSLAQSILAKAVAEGQDVANSKQIIYPNYALENTPLSMMYGNNVAQLISIRQSWDPENVMNRTGGFKFY
ncbi:unnamed protein product [Rotaria sordida]|uniref:Berberine/berberine-like domain-containing protein n=1 Tax=Rotaria sordida TaxID=392033 RepID=A0A819B7B2_9BILA|nr:unnamed protein product [Rotaria sordida]CAF1405377.1 unnamed protein product [Rotaria sordida]CAF3796261.1 unnamed protein product [Rotaria sordida]CAF4095139.1 unnamed protein product [Rotaria sordida]